MKYIVFKAEKKRKRPGGQYPLSPATSRRLIGSCFSLVGHGTKRRPLAQS
jgi:hypothetical protein